MSYVSIDLVKMRAHVTTLRQAIAIAQQTYETLSRQIDHLRLHDQFHDLHPWGPNGAAFLNLVDALNEAETVLARGEAITNSPSATFAGGTIMATWIYPPGLPSSSDDTRSGRSIWGTKHHDPGTDGLDPHPSTGLGPPITHPVCPIIPDPPVWHAPDTDRSVWNSRNATAQDYLWSETLIGAVTAAGLIWPDAARNLNHYLTNSGTDLDQPVDKMIEDLPLFRESILTKEGDLARAAVTMAQAENTTGPITFTVNTPWYSYYAEESESRNWYYATGGFAYNLAGHVSVHPPVSPGGPWTYEMTTVVNYRDRYNWDQFKEANFGPITIHDEQMDALNECGLAQVFDMTGQSTTRTTHGEI